MFEAARRDRVVSLPRDAESRGIETLTPGPDDSAHMSKTPDDGDDGSEGPVSPDDVRHVADLARVDLDDDEVETFTDQFVDILAYFEALDEVPAVDDEADLVNVMRDDEVHESLTQDEALSNAPETEGGYFVGPRVS
jgi:aspartyl-tRNA(Asn)/glutamyl-tRNA(Gln) amidotransferase subunit C